MAGKVVWKGCERNWEAFSDQNTLYDGLERAQSSVRNASKVRSGGGRKMWNSRSSLATRELKTTQDSVSKELEHLKS